MPVLPAMTAPSGTVAPGYWYTNGLFAPAVPAASLEILNGGLDSANYTGGDNSIPMAQVQWGAFATAAYAGFRRWEFLYARQFANDGTTTRGGRDVNRQVVGGLSARFFLPWAASLLWLDFHAFCRQDATEWDNNLNDGGRKMEFWDFRVYLDSIERTEMYGRLPHGRTSVSLPPFTTTAPPAAEPWTDPGYHSENRWRWFGRSWMATNAAHLSKGVHRLRVTTWPGIFSDDSKIAKLVFPSGGITVVALRA